MPEQEPGFCPEEEVSSPTPEQEIPPSEETKEEPTVIKDPLFFNERLKEEMRQATRSRSPLSLISLDIDNFTKKVIEQYGRVAGDEILEGVFNSLKRLLCPKDIFGFARFLGSEDFTAILPDTPKEEAARIAEEMRKTIEESSFHLTGKEGAVNLTCSFGVTEMSPRILSHFLSPQRLIHKSFKNVFEAKMEGKNRIFVD